MQGGDGWSSGVVEEVVRLRWKIKGWPGEVAKTTPCECFASLEILLSDKVFPPLLVEPNRFFSPALDWILVRILGMYMVSVFSYMHCNPTRLFFFLASFSKPFLFGLPFLQQALALQPIKMSIGEELIRVLVCFEIVNRQVTQLR